MAKKRDMAMDSTHVGMVGGAPDNQLTRSGSDLIKVAVRFPRIAIYNYQLSHPLLPVRDEDEIASDPSGVSDSFATPNST